MKEQLHGQLKLELEQALDARLAQLPAGRAVGARLRRETGVFCHELVLTEHGAKEELQLSGLPDGLDAAEGYLVYETLQRNNPQGLVFSPGSYATTRSTSTSFDFGTADMFIGQAFQSAIPRYHTFRSVIKFSLASLNPLAVIYAATLQMACVVDVSTLADFNVQIIKQDWSAQDPLSNGNREAVYDACLAGTMDVVWRNTNGLPMNTLISSPALDVNWLVPGGQAYYSLRGSRDAAGNAPASNGNEYVRLAAAAHSTPALRPMLMVDYFAVPSATGRLVQPSPRVRIQDTRIKLRARRRKTLLTAHNREA